MSDKIRKNPILRKTIDYQLGRLWGLFVKKDKKTFQQRMNLMIDDAQKDCLAIEFSRFVIEILFKEFEVELIKQEEEMEERYNKNIIPFMILKQINEIEKYLKKYYNHPIGCLNKFKKEIK